MKLKLNQIRKDIALSPREDTSPEVVEDYMTCFEQLPPIVVFKVPDQSNYLLADGWHRLAAAGRLNLEEIEVEARAGSYEDAKEYALLANLRHGRPLTRKEKRGVIGKFLKLHPERANQWIAKDLGCDKNTVEAIRVELESGCEIHTLNSLTGKDGKQYPRVIDKPKKEETEPEIETEEPSEPEVLPELEPPSIPTLGMYQLNKAYQVDCVEGLFNLPEASIDLIFTDPPYNIGVKYGKSSNDKMLTEQYFAWCSQWFMGCYRTLKPGGSFYIMHYPEVVAKWLQLLSMFTFKRWISWIYNANMGQSGSNWSRAHRTILYVVKGDAASFFDGEADPQPYKNPDDVRIKHIGKEGTTPYDWWEYNLVKNVSRDKTSWPNQLPVDLVKRIIVSSCPKDGVVCDPFMGSGTTAVAANETGRQWIGFDIEKDAQNIISQRVTRVHETNSK